MARRQGYSETQDPENPGNNSRGRTQSTQTNSGRDYDESPYGGARVRAPHSSSNSSASPYETSSTSSASGSRRSRTSSPQSRLSAVPSISDSDEPSPSPRVSAAENARYSRTSPVYEQEAFRSSVSSPAAEAQSMASRRTQQQRATSPVSATTSSSAKKRNSVHDHDRKTARSTTSSARSTERTAARTGNSGNSPYDGASSRLSGVRPVTRDDYVNGSLKYTYPDGPNSKKSMSRRGFIAAGACLGVAAALGVTGYAWWTHRAVACEINGTERTVPVSSSAQDLIDEGYAAPKNGNVLSIADANGDQTTLSGYVGQGEHWKLMVNGAEVDYDTYAVAEGDTIEFVDGADVTEPITSNDTVIPCGLQYPEDGQLLATIGYVAQWGKNGKSSIETGQYSGTTIDRGVVQQPQDLIISYKGINPDDGRNLIALTFDDGPDPTYTPQYLQILANYGIKATFFEIGLNIDQYPDVSKQVLEAGHQLASHTYSHTDLIETDAATVKTEIDKTFTSLETATGTRPSAIRPPYGNFYGRQFVENLGSFTYTAYWSVDSADWEKPGVDTIVYNCTKNIDATNYNGAVVLMHDGGGDRSEDLQALPTIIETYLNNGYSFVTLDELIKADSSFPEWVSSEDPSIPDDADMPDLTGI